MPSDFKDPPRKVDRDATRDKLLLDRECRGMCGHVASNGHHIIPKGAPHLGDDVPDNIIPLCGSGTTGCHGAMHGVGESTTWIKRRKRVVGSNLTGDELLYVVEKLGGIPPAVEFLRRFYLVDYEWALAWVGGLLLIQPSGIQDFERSFA